jgi:hypothetical protein
MGISSRRSSEEIDEIDAECRRELIGGLQRHVDLSLRGARPRKGRRCSSASCPSSPDQAIGREQNRAGRPPTATFRSVLCRRRPAAAGTSGWHADCFPECTMVNRLAMLALLLGGANGCSGASAPSGSVGSHVWFDSSTGIELKNVWSYDSWGPDAGPGQFGSSCLVLERAALDDEQRTALETLVLVPLNEQCTADGYTYAQLTVRDRDGSRTTYRDTGCSYLRIQGATGMLPPFYSWGSTFLPDPAASCPN